MALCSIKNVEQLKQHNVGGLGILIGLDRVPEARCWEKRSSKWWFKIKPKNTIQNHLTIG